MSLAANRPVAFIPTRKPEAAREFYEQTLGLRFESDDQFAMVFRVGAALEIMLRLVHAPEFTPFPFTLFGWEVDDIVASATALTGNGVSFIRHAFFEQDERGIWTAPGGARVAWFKDPDGNTLSISQHSS
jgi:predicted enzyme related to lactoylglutathione lyase